MFANGSEKFYANGTDKMYANGTDETNANGISSPFFAEKRGGNQNPPISH